MNSTAQQYDADYDLQLKQLSSRKERTIQREMEELIKYLTREDPYLVQHVYHAMRSFDRPCIDMRKRVRKTIGEKQWKKYLQNRSMYVKDISRIHVEDASAEKPSLPIPPYPCLSSALDGDVTTIIFDFLDEKSKYEASKVSREFRDALIPRQKVVTLDGFRSFESFRQLNFVGMESFVCMGGPLETNDLLDILANDRVAYPNLARMDIRKFSKTMSLSAAEVFINEMSPRLRDYKVLGLYFVINYKSG